MKTQNDMLTQINEQYQNLSHDWLQYWTEFSSFNTWQFWVIVFIFIAPLIVLFFKIDHKRAFQIGFFGFNFHCWYGYLDTIAINQGYWQYPYQIFPFIPNSLAFGTSLLPILFMFIYQRTLTNAKKFYLYSFLLSAFLAFVFRPIILSFNLFRFFKGENFLYVFIIFLITVAVSKSITDLFLYFQHKSLSD